jgi:hypothetical protein
MRLTHLAIIAIRGSKGIVPKLADAIKCSEPSVYKYIRENAPELTLAAALRVIRDETGLGDSQILEEEKTAA